MGQRVHDARLPWLCLFALLTVSIYLVLFMFQFVLVSCCFRHFQSCSLNPSEPIWTHRTPRFCGGRLAACILGLTPMLALEMSKDFSGRLFGLWGLLRDILGDVLSLSTSAVQRLPMALGIFYSKFPKSSCLDVILRFQLPIFSNEILMCLETSCWASNSKLPSRTPVPLAWQPDTELGGKMRKIGLGRVRDWEIVRVRKSGEVHSKGKSARAIKNEDTICNQVTEGIQGPW